MGFPEVRKRRLRKNSAMRDLIAETQLNVSQLVYPLFIIDEVNAKKPVASMPGVFQFSIDNAIIEIGKALKLGIKSFILFGVPMEKDQEATSAWDQDGIIQRALRAIRHQFGDEIILIADTCLCEYMSHGHCGVYMDGRVLNDPSLEILARTAVSQAEAGADIIAPSDMMDGRVWIIREALDEAGYQDTPILSYAAKYASSLYTPFRDAAESAPSVGDRKAYQMDYRNGREALEEVALDLSEGADMIMIKPALGYQDIIYQASQLTNVPIAAYSVSGEYSMIKAAAANGWLDEKAFVLEYMTGLRRAGAEIIVTYHAKDIANWLA